MKNQKIIIGALIAIIVILVVVGAVMLMDMNKKEIIIPEEYTLESNESGVATYVNNLSNGYKLEIKEEGNSNGIKNEDMYGTINMDHQYLMELLNLVETYLMICKFLKI